MSDDQDILNELAADVEAQGGTRLPDTHHPLGMVISYPSTKEAGHKDQAVHTVGCGRSAQFVVPYERDAVAGGSMVEEGAVMLCAYCDLMPSMSRFSGPPI